MTTTRRSLYLPIEPFASGFISVDHGHELYYEQSGNMNGKPVVFLHGGPGAGTNPSMRRLFDPAKYHIILFDQRGSGKSTPHASLDHNTTWDLVRDIETLRQHLTIDKWQVFGGSWGSTLALAYAQAHAGRVTEIVLRGIFMVRKQEVDWFYRDGLRAAGAIYPDRWAEYIKVIPEDERGDIVASFYKRLTSDDKETRKTAARAWSVWEGSTCALIVNDDKVNEAGGEDFAAALARIECHYFMNQGFMETETQLLDNIDKIRHIPTVIVQGRYDIVCPAITAWDLHKAFPEADFNMIPDAGHTVGEPGNVDALIRATDRFADA
jgi:proline iminopeptidase